MCQPGVPECWEALTLYDRVIAVGDLVSDGPAIAAKLILDSIRWLLHQTDIDCMTCWSSDMSRTSGTVRSWSSGNGQSLRREPLTGETIILTLRRPKQIYAHLFKPGACASQLSWLRPQGHKHSHYKGWWQYIMAIASTTPEWKLGKLGSLKQDD